MEGVSPYEGSPGLDGLVLRIEEAQHIMLPAYLSFLKMEKKHKPSRQRQSWERRIATFPTLWGLYSDEKIKLEANNY
eukprot:1145819-Pelagomonas_calceolata.AAC.2